MRWRISIEIFGSMSKKLAPPGRKASTKRETFKADESLIKEVPIVAIEQNSSSLPNPPPVVSVVIENQEQKELEVLEAKRKVEEAEAAAAAVVQQQKEAELAERRRVEEEAAAAEALAVVAAKKKAMEEEALARKLAEQEAAQKRREEEVAAAKERKRLEEEAAKRKVEEAAAARKHAEEEAAVAAALALAAAERKRQEEEAARQAAEEASAAELRRLEEERRLNMEEELKRIAQEEAEKLEVERLRAKEEADRLAAEQQAKREAELEAKRQQADEQRRKRAMFLSQMSSFTEDFEVKTQQKEEALQETEKKRTVLESNVQAIETSLKEKSSQPVEAAAAAVVVEEEEILPSKQPIKELPIAPPSPEPVPVVYKSTAAVSPTPKIEDLTASLFGEKPRETSPAALPVPAPIPVQKIVERTPSPPPSDIREESHVAIVEPVVTLPEEVTAPKVVEEEEKQRRKLTTAEKATWRAKQADLHTKRKNFHGAVTYMFDGIFSWQMYGSAEAIDEFGNTYTEYLMRCQWGSSFENLQPWIVAHRYKEFDRLDQELKKMFPQLEKNMPKLPKKEYFRTMDSAVIAKRRSVLEECMVKIVETMPTLLRSDLMDAFLRINERITTIKNLLHLNHPVQMSSTQGVEEKKDEDDGIPVTLTEPQTTLVDNTPIFTDPNPPLRRGQVISVDNSEVEEDVAIWTAEQAEEIKTEHNTPPMDEDQLGRFEEDLRNLTQSLRESKPKDIARLDSPVRKLVRTITKRWPALRATAVVNMGVDFSLIPRAMQAEEDLLRAINEFRNLETLRSAIKHPYDK
eukprot:gene9674-10697_t